MEESHGKGPASHPDPESCADGRKAGGEALTGAPAGQPSSCEIRSSGVPTPLCEAASISITSRWRLSMIAWQCTPSFGIAMVGPFTEPSGNS